MNAVQQAVLVTGACGGIGQSLCARFRSAGYYTIATDVVEHSAGCNCDHYVQANLRQLVADAGLAEEFAGQVDAALSGRKLKGLVNNAAVQQIAHLQELELEDFKDTLDVNVTAPALLTKMFLRALETAGGSVVNIGSIHAGLTKPAFISYATSKAALQGLTRALAVDLGGRVRVNLIQPAATDTAMLRAGFAANEAGLAALGEYHPASRLAMPKEIAAVALFLVSDECRFMTGSAINVDGGIGSRLHDPE